MNMSIQTQRASNWVVALTLIAITFASSLAFENGLLADDESTERAASSFSVILERQTRQTFQEIAKYVADNPKADDIEQAYGWLFATALNHGFEADAVTLAGDYVKRDVADRAVSLLAERVRCLGLAKTGKIKAAMSVFDAHLQSARFRSPNTTIDFARALATQARMANDIGAAREVFERLSNKFFLNTQVRQMCQNKLSKLELIDKAAPEIGAEDLQGQAVKLSDYRGKVVLVDFWATNCPPCLEEFPKMKQLYAEHHQKGFEIVGVSLDENPEEVKSFQTNWNLPWRLVVTPAKIRQLRDRYKVLTIPSVYLLDKQGRVVQLDIRGRDLRTAVERELGLKK